MHSRRDKAGSHFRLSTGTAPAGSSAVIEAPGLLVGALAICFWAAVFSPIAVAGGDDSPAAEMLHVELSDGVFLVGGWERAEIAALDKLAAAEQLAGVVSVHVMLDGRPQETAVLGELRVEDGSIVFQPRFAPQPGAGYLVRVRASRVSSRLKDVESQVDVPAAEPHPAAVVTTVYPTADELPENLLKFYLHFSAPMSRGEAYRRIHLLRADGSEVESPFLELEEELWDGRGTRFTLFFEPGRIKRGLRPREELGPALREGAAYELVIDAEWKDARGQPLAKPFRKAFRVTSPDQGQPDTAKWSIAAPAAGGREPLAVQFSEPLDHAMLERVLVIVDDQDRVVAGRIAIDREEARWRFTPAEDWRQGGYRLLVDTALEDRSGNSIGRPFEVDETRGEGEKPIPPVAEIPFEVQP